MIDIRLLEKTEGDRDISFPRRLIEFAENQKENPEIAFDKERDKMIVVFDGDIFEEKVLTIRLNLFFLICSSAIPIRITSYWSQGYSSSLGTEILSALSRQSSGVCASTSV